MNSIVFTIRMALPVRGLVDLDLGLKGRWIRQEVLTRLSFVGQPGLPLCIRATIKPHITPVCRREEMMRKIIRSIPKRSALPVNRAPPGTQPITEAEVVLRLLIVIVRQAEPRGSLPEAHRGPL